MPHLYNESMNTNRLSHLVLRYKAAYYAGKPIVPDDVYDKIEALLKQVSPNDPALAVGGPDQDLEKSKFVKIEHVAPMLSLDKRYDIGELKRWIDTNLVIETPKIDGNSCSLTYENGVLSRAASRGRTGTSGYDITDNVVFVLDVPKMLGMPVSCEVRGEIYMTKSDFEKFQKEDPEAKNPRNLAAGTLRQEDPFIVQKRCLHFLAYEIINMEVPLATETDKFTLLTTLGFKVPTWKAMLVAGVEQSLKIWKDKKSELEYEIDGIVFKYNDVKLQQELGATSHHPRYAMAFKWESSEKAIVPVLKIDWNTARNGNAIPRATVEPVELGGATIQHLTLHNFDFVKNHDIRPGSLIEIIKAGEIIPTFVATIDPGKEDPQYPTKCETCGTPLIHNQSVHLVCTNPKCEAQALQTLNGFVGALKKSGYEIDDLGESTIKALFDKGLVKTPGDFYRLTEDKLIDLQLNGRMLGDKTAAKVIANINSRRTLPLNVFLTALCIDGFGKGTSERLMEHFSTLENILKANKTDFVFVRDCGEITAEIIYNGLKESMPLINDLFTQIQIEVPKKAEKDTLYSKSFIITGTLSKPRLQIEAMIKNSGGRIVSGISSNTSYLVVGEKPGSKLEKAKKLGVKIITERELLEMIGS